MRRPCQCNYVTKKIKMYQLYKMRCITAHRSHVPETCALCYPVHLNLLFLSYIERSPSPNQPTDEIPLIVNWIKVRRGGWPRQNINSMSLQIVQNPVCGKSSGIILHQAHTSVISKSVCSDMHTGLQTLTMF